MRIGLKEIVARSRRIFIALPVFLLAVTLASAVPASAADTVHVVKSGDTLEKIARRYKTKVSTLRKLNPGSSSKLRPGDRLLVGKSGGSRSLKRGAAAEPKCGKALTHKVVTGDSLWEISRRFNVPVETITRLNGSKATKLKPGTVLVLGAARKCPGSSGESRTRKRDSIDTAADETWSEIEKRKDVAVVDGSGKGDSDEPENASGDSGTAPDPTRGMTDEKPEDGTAGSRRTAAASDTDEPSEAGPTIEARHSQQAAQCATKPEGTESGADTGSGGDVAAVRNTSESAEGQDEEPAVDEGEESDEEEIDDEPDDAQEETPPELPEFGFADDGVECLSYLDAISSMPTDRKGAVNIYHTVRKGDNVWKVAKKYHVSVKQLQKLNGLAKKKGKKGKRFPRVGQSLLIRVGDPKDLMVYRPFLKDWGALRSQPGYTVKRPTTIYGRPWAMKLMLRSICEYRRRVGETDPVVVGDWSGTIGGRLGRHKSHQTGRDVDLGYFIKGQKCGNQFVRATPDNLDVEKTWELVKALLDTRRVQFIFMDWNLQSVLYEHALSMGFPKADLDMVFQFPEPRRTRTGIIRWARGHDNHIHVRFSCPPEDEYCR